MHVTQPEGFRVKGSESKVYKLSKALYGLKQAQRAWNHKLNAILTELQFYKRSKKLSVYRKMVNNKLHFVAVYVDDLFVTRKSVNVINKFKKEMGSKFEMSDLES